MISNVRNSLIKLLKAVLLMSVFLTASGAGNSTPQAIASVKMLSSKEERIAGIFIIKPDTSSNEGGDLAKVKTSGVNLPSQALSPGPDDYGYTSGTTTYSWMSADTQIISWRDAWDCVKETDGIPIGFNFPFYENSYSTLYVSSTGLISFGWLDISSLRNNSPIPDSEDGNSNLIAAL